MSSQIARQTEGAFFKPERTFPKRSPNGFPVGKRTEERAKQNRELNKLKITRCELQLNGCVHDRMLTWAHSKKSRFLLISKDWQEAARACLPCHQQAEAMKHSEMHAIITGAIAKRKVTDL